MAVELTWQLEQQPRLPSNRGIHEITTIPRDQLVTRYFIGCCWMWHEVYSFSKTE